MPACYQPIEDCSPSAEIEEKRSANSIVGEDQKLKSLDPEGTLQTVIAENIHSRC
jgi:hypothetical protein